MWFPSLSFPLFGGRNGHCEKIAQCLTNEKKEIHYKTSNKTVGTYDDTLALISGFGVGKIIDWWQLC